MTAIEKRLFVYAAVALIGARFSVREVVIALLTGVIAALIEDRWRAR